MSATILADIVRRDFAFSEYLETPVEPHHSLVSDSYVGVEVEAEGVDAHSFNRRHGEILAQYWNIIRDGSLRGPSFEAVLSTPLAGEQLVEALSILEHACSDPLPGGRIEFNGRTSTHVHVNVTDMSLEQINKFLCVYLLFEDTIFNYVGSSRTDNNYCTRLVGDRSTDAMIQSLSVPVASKLTHRIEIGTPSFTVFTYGVPGHVVEPSKYSALNMRTLFTFGTMEFRHHQGESDASKLIQWINILLCMKKWAAEAPTSVEEFPAYLSGKGAESLGYEVFGNIFPVLNYEGIEQSVYRGVRLIQKALLGIRKVVVDYEECSEEESLLGRAVSGKAEDRKKRVIWDDPLVLRQAAEEIIRLREAEEHAHVELPEGLF